MTSMPSTAQHSTRSGQGRSAGASNRSKGDRAYTEWPQGSTHYSNVKLAEMRQLEAHLRAYLVARIAALRLP